MDRMLSVVWYAQVQCELADSSRSILLEITALRAKIAEMREQSLTQEMDIRSAHILNILSDHHSVILPCLRIIIWCYLVSFSVTIILVSILSFSFISYYFLPLETCRLSVVGSW